MILVLHLFTFQTPILVPIKIYNTFYYIFQNSGMFRNVQECLGILTKIG